MKNSVQKSENHAQPLIYKKYYIICIGQLMQNICLYRTGESRNKSKCPVTSTQRIKTNSYSSNGVNTAVTPPYYPSSANAELCTIRTGEVNELHLDKEGIFPLQTLCLPEEDLEEDYTEAVLDDTYKKQAIRFVVRRTTHN